MRARRVIGAALAVAVLGLALLVAGFMVDRDHAWFSYLDAWLFGTSIAVGALLLNMTGHVSKAGWMVVVRRLTESVASTLPLFALLFIPLAFGLGHIYPWASHSVAGMGSHKKMWLTCPFFIIRTGLYFAVFCTVSALLRTWSKANDDRPAIALVRRMRRLSGGGLPLVGLALTWASFDWSMSLEPEWSSTMFGFYFFAGSFVGAIGLVCIMLRLVTLGSADGAMRTIPVTGDHAQALGRVLFAMIILWAYVSFGQLLIDWIADVPDEVTYFARRTTGSWTAVTYFLVFGHFVIPFFALLNRRLKRRPTVLAFAGGWVFCMHFADVYWQVLPVQDPSGVRPHWLDPGAAMFVGGLACAWIVHRYVSAAALPRHVPELAEGLRYEAAL